MLLGNAALYVPGLIQLNLFLPANVAEAWGCANVWQCGLIPFVAGDLAKLIVASLAVPAGWALLDRFAAKPRPRRGVTAGTYMDIYWLGHACFRLRSTNASLSIITDPYASGAGGLGVQD